MIKAIFDAVFGSNEEVSAFDYLLNKVKDDDRLDSIQQKAYVMATVKHETARTYKPIEEYGKGKLRSYGKPDPITGQTYYGRGYVQITWKDNYKRLGSRVKADLVNCPELALERGIAYEILIQGMTKGMFTGKRLDDYINDDITDYHNARRIVNGRDKAALIAGYALSFEQQLRSN